MFCRKRRVVRAKLRVAKVRRGRVTPTYFFVVCKDVHAAIQCTVLHVAYAKNKLLSLFVTKNWGKFTQFISRFVVVYLGLARRIFASKKIFEWKRVTAECTLLSVRIPVKYTATGKRTREGGTWQYSFVFRRTEKNFRRPHTIEGSKFILPYV